MLKIADHFNNQYSSVIRHVSTKTARTVTKDTKTNKAADTDLITTDNTKTVIKKAKASKALGPDKLSTLHVKNLGNAGLQYLTSLFNLSIRTCQIPAIWKTSTIIPLLKP